MAAENPKVKAILGKARWHEERKMLRAILNDCGLAEAVKWRQLCYTHDDRNVAIIFAMKAYCGIGFFKGALLSDPEGILVRQGEHSQATRLIKATGTAEIAALEPTIRAYVAEAIEIENAGLKVDFRERHELELPGELVSALRADPALKAAWDALTPGRQRGYVLHIGAAKQSETRSARVEKHVPRILAGKGMHDR